MPEITVEIQGLNELRRALRDYPKISEPFLQKAINATGAIFSKHTLKNDPVPWRTGFLLSSFRFVTARLQARWFPTAKYAPFVEFGTRPHMIYPRNASVLAWQSGGGGKYVTSRTGRRYYKSGESSTVFSAHSRHTGTKPNPFMEKIVKRSQLDINKIFVEALDLTNQKIANLTRQI